MVMSSVVRDHSAVSSAGAAAAPLRRLYLYLAGDCNLKCRHCWIEPTFSRAGENSAGSYLPAELIALVLDEGLPLGLTGVKLTGGEPLLHPEFGRILELVRARGLQLVVETNGTLVDGPAARAIAECRGAFVSVSLDGAEEDTHDWVRGVPGSFRQAAAGIRALREAGLKPQLIMTVMRHNHRQLEGVVELARSLGAGSVKFNLVQPISRGEKMMRAGQTLTVPELVDLGRWVERDLAKRAGIPVFFSHPPAFRPLSCLGSGDGRGGRCAIVNILGVLADGGYALCGIGEHLPELVFGRAGQDALRDIWFGHPTLVELRRGLPGRLQGICARCVMSAYCLGHCLAQNYYQSRNLWAPYWYCEAAYAAGLFPASRLKAPGGGGGA